MRVIVMAAALVLAQQPNEAEALFKKLEEKLAKAETVEVSFTSTFELNKKGQDKITGQLNGSILLQKGNKLRLDLKGEVGRPIATVIISDGTTTAFGTKDEGTPPPTSTAAALNRNALLLLTRTSAAAAVMEIEKKLVLDESDRRMKEMGETVEPRETDPQKAMKLGEFKTGPGEKVDGKDAVLLRFECVEVDKPEIKVNISLWIDSATQLPLKRRIAVDAKGILIEESYGSFKLDGKIEAAKFELPK